ncbi:MAG: hypothetical protein DIZ78_01710 [endosymbiont of Escarpia spicata]|uniref:Uncharacterized protein n=1 Tax=endosymbiont of Escarpia spicata TaxID=2200908 RepID=A0A370DSJ7_9GAMM|nr:MAG: hypothetical protein DIZ78_01710 [endosymbiont of Escarpia spicata]
MFLIKYLLHVCAVSILLVSTGSADPTQPAKQYSISDLINNALLSSEVTVLVQVRKITGVDAQGRQQVLYENKAGKLVQLDLLASTVQRLDGRMISVGKYEDIQLELSNDVHLLGKNSVVLRTPFSDQKGTATIKAEGEIHVSPARVVTSQIKIEMGEFSRPLPPALVRALLAAIPASGCSTGAIC